MVEALELQEIADVPVGLKPRPASPVYPPVLSPTAPRGDIVASIAAALEYRRLFVLIPFAMIAGVIVCFDLPWDPQPLALAAGGAVLAGALVVSLRSIAWLRIVTLLAAFWGGLCLLPIHGALVGTAMLSRPAYGTYQARVDDIVAATAAEQRVVVSQITPTGSERALPVRRARILIKNAPALAPGDVISGSFRFAPVPGPVFPGGYDTQFSSYFDGIGAYGNSIHRLYLLSAGPKPRPSGSSIRFAPGLRSASTPYWRSHRQAWPGPSSMATRVR